MQTETETSLTMKVLTILGTATSLPNDIDKFGIEGDIMAVNRAIADCRLPIKYAVSLHNDLLDWLMEYRRITGINFADVIKCQDRHQCALPTNTSGLFALWLSQQLDYDKVRVLGLSADDSGHYYDVGPTGKVDFKSRFPSDNEEWQQEFSKWKNIEVASGNLLMFFPQLTK